jgi:hypothetical protein
LVVLWNLRRLRFGLTRPTAWPETGRQSQTLGGRRHPRRMPLRSTATQAFAQGLDLRLGLRFLDPWQPIRRPGHGAGVQQRRRRAGCRRTGPAPILRRLDQAGTHGVALEVAEHGQQMLVLLDREGAVAALPDMAARMEMLMVRPLIRIGSMVFSSAPPANPLQESRPAAARPRSRSRRGGACRLLLPWKAAGRTGSE